MFPSNPLGKKKTKMPHQKVSDAWIIYFIVFSVRAPGSGLRYTRLGNIRPNCHGRRNNPVMRWQLCRRELKSYRPTIPNRSAVISFRDTARRETRGTAEDHATCQGPHGRREPSLKSSRPFCLPSPSPSPFLPPY